MRTIVIGILGIVLLAACRTGAATTTAALPTLTRDATTDGDIQVVLATSEFVVGPNRVALGILENNVPIADAAQTQVKTRFYRIDGEQAMLVGEEAARFYGEGLDQRGTFIVHPTFDRAGQWGLEVEAQRAGRPATTQRLGVTVRERGSAAMIGTTAPRTRTPTSAQVKDLKTISSATKPDPRLYELSVDQAVTSGKPSLILFATPGFCQTQVCGPGVDVLSQSRRHVRREDQYGACRSVPIPFRTIAVSWERCANGVCKPSHGYFWSVRMVRSSIAMKAVSPWTKLRPDVEAVVGN